MLSAENPTVDFSHDNGWVVVGKALFIFVFLVALTILTIWGERRIVARMQSRPGPNRVGPFGIIQGLVDGVKLALKEDIVPQAVDKVVFVLAPLISCTTCFLAFSVIPFGPEAQIPFTDIRTPLQLTDLPIAVLFALAIAAVGVYGILLAGWSSGSTYPLLGALRSTAQVISYEIAMGLALISVFLYAGSMSTSQIVTAQATGSSLTFGGAEIPMPSWFSLQLPVAFIIYCIAMVGETNRAPFDLPEAEGELVGGFHTEYSSLKFALFFLAEYVNLITVSAIATTLFLGGWRAPWPLSAINDGMLNQGWWPMLWFVLKLLSFIFVFIWLRGTLPRLRYDQFMRFGWKFLIPGGLLWIVAVSLIRAMRVQQPTGLGRWLVLFGLAAIVLFVLWAFLASTRREEEAAAARRVVVPPEIDPFEGGYPVPPMPGQTIRRTAGPVLTARAVAAGRSEAVVPSGARITAESIGESTSDSAGDSSRDDEEVRGG